MKLECRWSFRDRVWLDGEGSIEGIVTGFQFDGEDHAPLVAVSWIHNGEAKSAWFQDWRLSAAT